jgi:hypothetical protein
MNLLALTMRWLAIHLPALPLEVYTRALQAEVPLAVSRGGKVERVLLCNRSAHKRGIHPGQPLGGALAPAADLRVLEEASDLRRRFEPPARYRGRLELPAELLQVDALVFRGLCREGVPDLCRSCRAVTPCRRQCFRRGLP